MKAQRNRLLQIRDDYNTSHVYNEIRGRAPIRKSQLGLDLPISKPTRYSIINSLIADKLVIELKPKGGKTRRTSYLDIQNDLFYTVGIDIHLEGIDFLLMDLKLQIKDSFQIANSIDTTRNVCLDDRDTVIERVKKGLLSLLDRNGLRSEDILSVGVSDFGTIDAKEGISIYTPHIAGWTEVPLRGIIQRIIPVPVYLGRDANLITVAEIKHQDLSHYGDLLCISLRRGVGFGIFIEGHLYTGYSGNAGELSHTAVIQNGKKCVCGKRGCLDTIIGYSAIMEKITEFYHSHTATALHDLAKSADDLSLQLLFSVYETGAKEIRSLLRFFIDNLARQIANMFYIFDPYLLILSGRFDRCGELFLEDLQKTIEAHFPVSLHKKIGLIKGKLGMKAASWGAAYMAQEMILNPEHPSILKKQERRTVSSMVSQRMS